MPREKFVFAVTMNSAVWDVTHIVAPGVAGGIIASVGSLTGNDHTGAGASFYVAFLGFVIMVVAMGMVRVAPARRSGGATVFHDIVEGIVFVRRNRVFLSLLGL